MRATLVALLGLVVATAGASLAGVTPASASTTDGTATIETPSLGTLAYPAASTAQFTVSLPAGAACTGNTSSDGYHVWTYLVPVGTNVSSVTIVNEFPSTGYGIFDATGSYAGPYNTAISDQITTLPNNFEWGPFVNQNSLLSAILDNSTTGVWNAGIACANSSGVITDYWNTQVTFTASNTDPNGFTWSALPGDPNEGAAPEVPYTIVIPLLAVGIFGATLLIRRRRSAAPVSSGTAV